MMINKFFVAMFIIEVAHFDIRASDNCQDYIDTISNFTTREVSIFTNIIQAEEGTMVSFLCGACPVSEWNAGRRIVEECTNMDCDNRFSVECHKDYSNLTYTVTQEPFHDHGINGNHTFFCMPQLVNCTRGVTLPICFNGTISYIILVQVLQRAPVSSSSSIAIFPSGTIATISSSMMSTPYNSPSSPSIKSTCDSSSSLTPPTMFGMQISEGAHSKAFWVALSWTLVLSVIITLIVIGITVLLAAQKCKQRKCSGDGIPTDSGNDTLYSNSNTDIVHRDQF